MGGLGDTFKSLGRSTDLVTQDGSRGLIRTQRSLSPEKREREMSLLESLINEMNGAEDQYGPFASTHEALGVITEEFYELLTAVRLNYPESIKMESIQIAAACMRLAEQCDKAERTNLGSFAKRSGFHD